MGVAEKAYSLPRCVNCGERIYPKRKGRYCSDECEKEGNETLKY